ncbi:hypothetical protein GGR57DRAFT_187826 [Xylariaceae sp. FL1272]|nr:hypothetical protein GGR57DRAFT_187826 [Xylariaceae sp. FL1272]
MDPYSTNGPRQQPPQQQPQYQRRISLEDVPPQGNHLQGQHHRRNNSRFDTHDDFYDFLDKNRGPHISNGGPPATTTANHAAHIQPPQPSSPRMQQPQQPSQQRMPPPPNQSQSRPPVTNNFPDRSRPPSYAGSSRSEEQLTEKSQSAKMSNPNARRGAPRGATSKPASGPRPPPARSGSPTPPVSGGSSPTRPQHHLSLPDADQGIPRLKSPSVLDHVLKPLEQKVREYEQFMHREQDEMRRLDDEIRTLQAQRAEADARFTEAKLKHDEYRRQHTDVERAMSGELPMSPLQRPATMHAQMNGQQRPMSEHQRRLVSGEHDDDDDDDDDEDTDPHYGPNRRINSQQSFGRASMNTATKEKFRFSKLFGGAR